MSSLSHSFNVDHAVKLGGPDRALVFSHIAFWFQRNRANNRNYFMGTWWTYNAIKSFEQIFPYWSSRQIRSILERLETDGYTKTGNFNEMKYDRTLWYTLTEKGEKLADLFVESVSEKVNTISENVKWNSENVEPIPDTYTDTYTDTTDSFANFSNSQPTTDFSAPQKPPREAEKKAPPVPAAPPAKKAAVWSASKKAAEAFDRERERIGLLPKNWQMSAGRDFKALHEIYKGIEALAEKRKGRALTDEEMISSDAQNPGAFEVFLSWASVYLTKAARNGGAVELNPHTVQKTFDQIISDARSSNRPAASQPSPDQLSPETLRAIAEGL